MIYLDHAATSFPKPEPVLDAVQHWLRDIGVSADRGDSELCAEVAGVVEDVRHRLAGACGTVPERIAFTSGATEGLNLALRGLLRRGDRVLTTAAEHSSLVRPLVALRAELELDVTVIPTDAAGVLDPAAFATAQETGDYRLLAFSQAGNVTGATVDAAAVCAAARQHGCLTLLDASQSAGLLPLDVGADVVVASAHKSLLAPPGLGFLAAGENVCLRQTKQGGTGSAAALDHHPPDWPQAFEAGTPNTPALFGLHAALVWLDQHPGQLERSLARLDLLRGALAEREDVRLIAPPPGAGRVPVLSFTVRGLDPAEVGVLLAEARIHCRTGFHCAPWIHRHLGTAGAGTVRISVGPFNTDGDVLAVARALPPGS